MKNKINYLFLIEAFIIWIFVLILFLMNIIKLNQKELINKIIEQNKNYNIAFVIVSIILVCLLIAFYFWSYFLKIKRDEIKFSKLYTKNMYLCTLITIIDLILSTLFISLGTNEIIRSNFVAFNIVALVISSVALIINIFYSYFLDVGYNFSLKMKNKSFRNEKNNE